jgi:hypothetical protein
MNTDGGTASGVVLLHRFAKARQGALIQFSGLNLCQSVFICGANNE